MAGGHGVVAPATPSIEAAMACPLRFASVAGPCVGIAVGRSIALLNSAYAFRVHTDGLQGWDCKAAATRMIAGRRGRNEGGLTCLRR